MNTKTSILLSLGAAFLTASLGAFWFWSMGCPWVPGEKLGLAVGSTIFATVAASGIAFVASRQFTPPKS